MSKRRIHIIFVLPSLAAGGAERILSYVAQNLDTEVFKVTLLITGYEKDTVYQLENLHIEYLNKSRVLKAFGRLHQYFRKHKPDIVVSSIVHLNTMIAFMSPFFRKTKFVSREANVLTVLNEHNPYTNSAFPKAMIVMAYKLVDCIICQSKDMQKDMVANYKVPIDKTVLINNPITKDFKLKGMARDSSKPLQLITIGRLSKEKGHERLIEVLSELKFPFEYTIIGSGMEKDSIFEMLDNKGLTKNIKYINYTNDVEKYLAASDLFLQGSYVEGFPNVLIESCVAGTPILAFNAPGGLDEIIEHGKNGYVADTKEDYLAYLNQINDEFPFNPETVSAVVKRKFNSTNIINEYTSLFLNLSQNNQHV
ncbi:glycosyltransferase [Bizionia myxarmorum]|uniref:Glycosyltransferase n=1 Tax=Bizionia myxarmorum TaxID=291186 RepID=A0A5D0R6P2_9FLAO|nr:glycosyltransferase [Bizionia myxarmorum]TYB76234.1 glycosyltransferase [Bizionia myxarmorum]